MLVGIATTLGFELRYFRLENQAFWWDELVTREYAHEKWARLFGDLATVDVHPPLYYMLQKAWLVVGESRLAMRSLPAILGAACIPLIYLLGRRLGGNRVGIVAAFMLSSAPLHVILSREIRQYTLLSLFALLAILSFAYLIPIGATVVGRAVSRRVWLGYVVGSAGAFYAHNTALVLPALASVVVMVLWLQGRVDRNLIRTWLVLNAAVLALVLPWLWLSSYHLTHTLNNFWLPYPSLSWVKSQFLGAYPYPRLLKPVFMLIALFGVWSLRQNRLLLLFVLAFWIGEPLTFWLVSYVRPVLYCRPLVWSTLLFPILAAIALERLRTGPLIAATAALATLQAVALLSDFPANREQMGFEALVPHLSDFTPDTDILVIGPQQFDPELRVDAKQVDFRRNAISIAYADLPEKVFEPLFAPRVPRAQLYDHVRGYRRVWLYTEIEPRFPVPPRDNFDQALRELELHASSEQRWASGDRVLMLFDIDTTPHG